MACITLYEGLPLHCKNAHAGGNLSSTTYDDSTHLSLPRLGFDPQGRGRPIFLWTFWASNVSCMQGKVILVVNVASQCGFTPQYKELAELDNKYKRKGLVILGFPCNQVWYPVKVSLA